MKPKTKKGKPARPLKRLAAATVAAGGVAAAVQHAKRNGDGPLDQFLDYLDVNGHSLVDAAIASAIDVLPESWQHSDNGDRTLIGRLAEIYHVAPDRDTVYTAVLEHPEKLDDASYQGEGEADVKNLVALQLSNQLNRIAYDIMAEKALKMYDKRATLVEDASEHLLGLPLEAVKHTQQGTAVWNCDYPDVDAFTLAQYREGVRHYRRVRESIGWTLEEFTSLLTVLRMVQTSTNPNSLLNQLEEGLAMARGAR